MPAHCPEGAGAGFSPAKLLTIISIAIAQCPLSWEAVQHTIAGRQTGRERPV
jgi:hypothetical protein